MLKKLFFFILWFLAFTPNSVAFTQQPSGMVRVELHVYIVDPNQVGKPIRRQPSVGITAYVGNGMVYVQDFNKSFTLRLTNANNGADVFSTNVITGQTSIPIPKELYGDYFMYFIFEGVIYRTQIHL